MKLITNLKYLKGYISILNYLGLINSMWTWSLHSVPQKTTFDMTVLRLKILSMQTEILYSVRPIFNFQHEQHCTEKYQYHLLLSVLPINFFLLSIKNYDD